LINIEPQRRKERKETLFTLKCLIRYWTIADCLNRKIFYVFLGVLCGLAVKQIFRKLLEPQRRKERKERKSLVFKPVYSRALLLQLASRFNRKLFHPKCTTWRPLRLGG